MQVQMAFMCDVRSLGVQYFRGTVTYSKLYDVILPRTLFQLGRGPRKKKRCIERILRSTHFYYCYKHDVHHIRMTSHISGYYTTTRTRCLLEEGLKHNGRLQQQAYI